MRATKLLLVVLAVLSSRSTAFVSPQSDGQDEFRMSEYIDGSKYPEEYAAEWARRDDDYEGLRDAVNKRIDELSKLAKKAQEKGITTDLEQGAMTIASMFLRYAAYDRENQDELEQLYLAYAPHQTQQATEWSQSLPKSELNATLSVLNAHYDELESVVRGELHRPASAMTKEWHGLHVCQGSFCVGEDKVVPGGYNTVQQEDYDKLGTSIVAMWLYLPDMMPNDDMKISEDYLEKVKEWLDSVHAAGLVGQIFFGKLLPAWAEKEDPSIVCDNDHLHSIAYDIDNPLARKIIGATANSIATAMKGHPALFGYGLANEPAFFSTQSTYTLAKFQEWLKVKYTTTDNLSVSWDRHVESFADVDATPVLGECNSAEWYDWNRFNQIRVTDFFSFMRASLQESDPGIPCHIKIINGLTLVPATGPAAPFVGGESTLGGDWQQHANGLDREALIQAMDINGCDTQVLPTADGDSSPYVLNWISQSASFDFQKSMNDTKPIFDSEWHSVSTVRYRDSSIPRNRIVLASYLAYSHGLAANVIWYWGRNPDGSPSPGMKKNPEWFAEALLTQPQLVDGYFSSLVYANTFAAEFERLARADRSVCVLYSEASAIQSTTYLSTQLLAYDALYWSGYSIRFVTENSVGTDTHRHNCRWLAIADLSHCEDSTVEALEQLTNADTTAEHGGEGVPIDLLLFGERDRILTYNPEGVKRVASDLSWLRRWNVTSLRSSSLTHSSLSDNFATVQQLLEATGSAPDRMVVTEGGESSPGVFGVVVRSACSEPSSVPGNFSAKRDDMDESVDDSCLVMIANLLFEKQENLVLKRTGGSAPPVCVSLLDGKAVVTSSMSLEPGEALLVKCTSQ